jgi:hypothetical protein
VLEGGRGTGYDVLFAETEPNLVAMELDFGWSVAAISASARNLRALIG